MLKSTPKVVAVVDDDRRVLQSLEALLQSAGFDVRLYASADAFLQSGELARIHCLISDIRMPVTDGWELESIVSRVQPTLPVIFITGDDLAQQEAHSRHTSGRSRLLFRKPFIGAELIAAIRSATEDRAN
jgi:FixJ family two-component response regulator